MKWASDTESGTLRVVGIAVATEDKGPWPDGTQGSTRRPARPPQMFGAPVLQTPVSTPGRARNSYQLSGPDQVFTASGQGSERRPESNRRFPRVRIPLRTESVRMRRGSHLDGRRAAMKVYGTVHARHPRGAMGRGK